MINYLPQNILTTENMPTKGVVTSEHWNELFNLLISQGNNSSTALYNLIAAIEADTGAADVGAASITGVVGTTVQTIMAGLKGLIDLCYTASSTDTLLSQKETVADANQLVKTIGFNSANGVFTITTQGGTVSTIDTALEKVAINFAYDSETQSLILTLADGSTTTVPLSAFITETEFLDSATIDFSVNNHTVTATIKSGSITETMLTSATLTALVGYKTAAETSATNAAASEANALTYKNAAGVSAGEALASKNAATISETNSKTSETNSKTSETNSGASASAAAISAGQALQYRNEASQIVGEKVLSFNGRKDAVVPVAGDYTAEQVGAIPTSQKGVANGVASLDGTGKVPSGQLPVVPLSAGGTGGTTAAAARTNIGAAQKLSGTATLAVANWTGTAAPYTYTLAVSGMLATDVPTIDYVGGTDQAAAELIKTAWQLAAGSYTKPQTAAGQLIFKAKEKPVTNIPVYWEVMR